MISNSIAALNDFNETNHIEGHIGCTLDILYPDLGLVDPTKGGRDFRVQRLTEKVHKQFAKVDWQITQLKGNLFNVIDLMHDILPHKVTTAIRKNKYQLERSIEIAVPCRVNFQTALFVLDMLLKMVIPEWFQYAARARLTTWATTFNTPDRVLVLEEVGQKVPWRYWLRKDNHQEAVGYFKTPGIAEIVAKECRGYYMNADKAERGERTVRRYLYQEGARTPLSVSTPDDIIELVEKYNFCAFYSSVESRSGNVGKICIDLDARWLLSILLGPERTWSLMCALVDAILALTSSLNWPSPAIKFSGARGMHLYWNIEPEAVGDKRIEIEPYIQNLLRIDKDIEKKKTTESFLHPFQGMKVMFQALVLAAKSKYMDWSRSPIPIDVLEAMGLKDITQLITVGGMEDRSDFKLSIDILSQKKAVFRSILSPHFKSGLVSRNIRNEFGQITTEHRVWRLMKKSASIEQVMQDVQNDPESMKPRPGILSKSHLTRLAELVDGEISMISKFSPSTASELTPKKYERYRKRYSISSIT